ncbi:MAG: uroporphyrinogen decarboxylase family protein [Candidatus Helarchaeota archaeon]
MNSLDRVITTLEHKEPDRVPIFGDLIDSIKIIEMYDGPQIISSLKSIINVASWLIGWRHILSWFYRKLTPIRENYLLKLYKFYENLGADLTYFMANPPLYIKFLDKNTIVTDWGSKMKIQKLPEGAESFYYVGGYWTSKEDYDEWDIPSADDPKIDQIINGYQKIRKKVNEIVILPSFGEIFGRIWNGFGMELFTKLLYQEQKFIKRVFEDSGSYTFEKIKRFMEIDPPPEIIWLSEDLGEKLGPIMSPKFLQKYIYPWHKKICNVVHKNGSKIILHSCGNIRKLIPDFIESGFDGLNPIQSTVPMDIFEIHEKFGDKITLVGNVPMPLLTNGTVEEVKDYTIKLIKNLGPGGGFIMAADHSIPPNTIPENYIEGMLNITKKYGVYPIKF